MWRYFAADQIVCMILLMNIDQCLKAHIQSSHQHVTCEICLTKQSKRNISGTYEE
ncbi:transcription factor iiia [Quercus suber]|uniref:Transcription factor iiia n=1 Tax=Quercus suber TaxID=58331 RepID=A0AAW0LS54_QUESU